MQDEIDKVFVSYLGSFSVRETMLISIQVLLAEHSQWQKKTCKFKTDNKYR